MPKIMFINCSCTGSTGKIVSDIADSCVGEGFDCVLCSPLGNGKNANVKNIRTSFPYEQGIYRRINTILGYQYGFAPVSTQRIKSAIKKESPDLVHLHCLNGDMVNIYSLVRFLKKEQIPVVITNHAEFYYTGSCSHALDCEKWLVGCGNCPNRRSATRAKLFDPSAKAFEKMRIAFDGWDAVMVSVSPWVESRASMSRITAHLEQKTVLNGVNTKIFRTRDTASLKEKHKLDPATRVILHVTSQFSNAPENIKGGYYLLELARRIENENAVIFIAGNDAVDFELPKNVIALGKIYDQDLLAEYYSMADVTILTSKKETFGMAVAESLCCGTPVVAFYSGGSESIAIDEFCRFVDFADVDALCHELMATMNTKKDSEAISRAAKSKYDSNIMAKKYIDIYKSCIEGKNVRK